MTKGRKEQSQAGPKGPKPARWVPTRIRGPILIDIMKPCHIWQITFLDPFLGQEVGQVENRQRTMWTIWSPNYLRRKQQTVFGAYFKMYLCIWVNCICVFVFVHRTMLTIWSPKYLRRKQHCNEEVSSQAILGSYWRSWGVLCNLVIQLKFNPLYGQSEKFELRNWKGQLNLNYHSTELDSTLKINHNCNRFKNSCQFQAK